MCGNYVSRVECKLSYVEFVVYPRLECCRNVDSYAGSQSPIMLYVIIVIVVRNELEVR